MPGGTRSKAGATHELRLSENCDRKVAIYEAYHWVPVLSATEGR